MMRCFQMTKNKKQVLFFFVFLLIPLCVSVILFQNTLFQALFPEKVWVHRVNSIEKRNEVQSVYSGLEIDVDYNSANNIFDVNHPPARSISLNLYDYLEDCKLRADFYFWLDFKNLSLDNAAAAVERLDSISKSLGIKKSTIIVEAFAPDALQVFSASGYKTSYYLTPDNYTPSAVEADDVAQNILDVLVKSPTSYISFDRQFYPFVKSYFPDYPKLTWGFYELGFYGGNRITFRSFLVSVKAFFLKTQLLLDDNVQVLLLPFDSEHGNR